MLVDYTGADRGKPYVVASGGQDTIDALNSVQFRHNNGAVFAYVDGHVGWLDKNSVTKDTFTPSAVGPGTLGNPESLLSTAVTLKSMGYAGYRYGAFFSTASAGKVTQYRFYRHPSDTSTSHTFRLFTVDEAFLPVTPGAYTTNITATYMADSQASTSGEVADAWTTADIATPVALDAKGTYLVTCDSPTVHVYWSDAVSLPRSNGSNLTLLKGIQSNNSVGTDTYTDRSATWITNVDIVFVAGM
ncbi:MAG: DUF4082 domain-containing protein [Armatimonadota bacterium]